MTTATTPHGIALAIALSLIATPSTADEPTPDKSGFTLFNPTPRELMRDISPDRPDATESPITVDAGHAQVELSFFDYRLNDADDGETRAWTIADTNVRVGLSNNTEIQFIFGLFGEETFDPSPGPDSSDRGFSDLTIRYKWNLWGNDSGDTAFAIMPFVTIPTGTELSTDEAEGGVVAMFGWDVAETWSVGGQVELDFVYDDEDGDHDTEFLHTFVLGFDIVGPLGGYIEYIGIASGDGGTDYQVLGSTGLTWQINENLVFDVGTQIGLTDDADDFNIFTGMTIRF